MVVFTYIKFIFWLLLSIVIFENSALKCDQIINNQNLPCIEIYNCNVKFVNVTIDLLSNGKGISKSNSIISLCYSESALQLVHYATKQTYLESESLYKNCNDPIFNSNVAELFIAPYVEETPHCYNELDISPFNIMFDSGIYNPNLNHSGVQGTSFPCISSNITHSTSIEMNQNQWIAQMFFPFSLLNCPYNCPNNRYNYFNIKFSFFLSNLF